MAFIKYGPKDPVPPECLVDDDDNILRIHYVHPKVLRLHYDLYVELMHEPGSLTRVQREMIGTAVSAINGCHY